MDILKAKESRIELEKKILELIREFENEVQCIINDVDVVRSISLSEDGLKEHLVRVDLKVNL